MADKKKREKADFEILKNNHYKNWYLDSKFQENKKENQCYISYRQFLCHAAWGTKRYDEAKESLMILQKLCAQENDNIDLKDINKLGVIDIHYCKTSIEDDGIDLLIMDKSHGCYPLYINKNTRKNSLKFSVNDVINKWNKIVSILKNANKWSAKIEKQLDLCFFGNKSKL